MPYIPKEDRPSASLIPSNAGELNFCLSTQVGEYLRKKGLNYQNINEVMGVLECLKLELYCRVARPYEDLKKSTNGDIRAYECLNEAIIKLYNT